MEIGKHQDKVYTYGVFDLLHIGHIKSLKSAKQYGHLTVGVFSDRVAESFKRKPIIPEEQRIAMIKELKCVDEVILLDKLVPDVNEYDIVAKGEGAGYEDIDFPITKVLLPYTNGVSTSKIIKTIRDRKDI